MTVLTPAVTDKTVTYWGKPVEVRKTANSCTWYHAVLTDIKTGDLGRVRFPRHYTDHPDAYMCTFQENVNQSPESSYIWPEKVLSIKDCIREVMKISTSNSNSMTSSQIIQSETESSSESNNNQIQTVEWVPQQGELVELAFDADTNYPSGWALGRIAGQNGAFFFVKFEEDPNSTFTQQDQTVIVKKDVLRKLNLNLTDYKLPFDPESDPRTAALQKKSALYSTKSICNGSSITKRTVVLPDSLEGDYLLNSWVQSENGQALFFHLKLKHDLLMITAATEVQYTRDDHGIKNKTPMSEIYLFSASEDRVDLDHISLLIQIHWYHQQRIQTFARQRESKLSGLLTMRKKLDQGRTIVLNIPNTATGLLVGKKGAQIKALEKKFGVEINVEMLNDSNPNAKTEKGFRKVTIFGFDADVLEKVRKLANYTEEIIDMPNGNDSYQWLKAKCNLGNLSKDCGGCLIYYDPKKKKISLKGLLSDVEEAQTIIEGHLSYYSDYKSMQKDKAAIDKKEDSLQNEYGVKSNKGRRNNNNEKNDSKAESPSDSAANDKKSRKGESRNKDKKDKQNNTVDSNEDNTNSKDNKESAVTESESKNKTTKKKTSSSKSNTNSAVSNDNHNENGTEVQENSNTNDENKSNTKSKGSGKKKGGNSSNKGNGKKGSNKANSSESTSSPGPKESTKTSEYKPDNSKGIKADKESSSDNTVTNSKADKDTNSGTSGGTKAAVKDSANAKSKTANESTSEVKETKNSNE